MDLIDWLARFNSVLSHATDWGPINEGCGRSGGKERGKEQITAEGGKGSRPGSHEGGLPPEGR